MPLAARALGALCVTLLVLAGPSVGTVRSEGVIDGRGNVIRAGVTGKPDVYYPTEWLMRLDVSAMNAFGQPIVGAKVTFERDCRLGTPCPFKGLPEPVGETDVNGRLVYTWTERNVPKNTQQMVEGAVHVQIPPDWVSVQIFYTVGSHASGIAGEPSGSSE